MQKLLILHGPGSGGRVGAQGMPGRPLGVVEIFGCVEYVGRVAWDEELPPKN